MQSETYKTMVSIGEGCPSRSHTIISQKRLKRLMINIHMNHRTICSFMLLLNKTAHIKSTVMMDDDARTQILTMKLTSIFQFELRSQRFKKFSLAGKLFA